MGGSGIFTVTPPCDGAVTAGAAGWDSGAARSAYPQTATTPTAVAVAVSGQPRAGRTAWKARCRTPKTPTAAAADAARADVSIRSARVCPAAGGSVRTEAVVSGRTTGPTDAS